MKQTIEKPQEQDTLLTIKEVAKQLRVDDTTVTRWIKNGVLEAIELPHVNRRLYRVRQSVIDKVLQPTR